MKSIQSSQDRIYIFQVTVFFFQHQIQNYLILGIRDEAIEMVNLAPAEMEHNEEAKGAKEYEKEETSFKVEVNRPHSIENEGMAKILIPLLQYKSNIVGNDSKNLERESLSGSIEPCPEGEIENLY